MPNKQLSEEFETSFQKLSEPLLAYFSKQELNVIKGLCQRVWQDAVESREAYKLYESCEEQRRRRY